MRNDRQTKELSRSTARREIKKQCLSFLCTASVLFLCSQKAYISFQETDSIR